MSVPLTVIRKHDLDICHLPNLKYHYFNYSPNFRINTACDKMHFLKGVHYDSLGSVIQLMNSAHWPDLYREPLWPQCCNTETNFLHCSRLGF